jgi:hypothetical protein
MSLDNFREPTTPESRVYRAMLLAGFSGAVWCLWRLFVGARYAVEIAVAVAVSAMALAVWRYLRQPNDSARKRSR